MKRLWWRFLDRFFPRYVIGYDPGTQGEWQTAVVMKRRRDGTYLMVDARHWAGK